jgi:sugar phosphate isomerase/epimerase
MADIFFAMEESDGKKTPEKNKKEGNPSFLMSSDSFSNCGLDLIFELTKESGFDGIDLAIWKNFDARNVSYVKKLSKKHDLPVKIIQVSENVNQKELNKALDLCEAT